MLLGAPSFPPTGSHELVAAHVDMIMQSLGGPRRQLGRLYVGAPGAPRRDIYRWHEGESMTQHASEDDDGMLALGVSVELRELLHRLTP